MNTQTTTRATVGAIRRNIMGTVDVDLKAGNMRRAASFIVYPVHAGSPEPLTLRMQAEHRVATIDADNGRGMISQAIKGHPALFYANAAHGAQPFDLSPEDLQRVREAIAATANRRAGTNDIVYTDNSGAAALK